MEYQAVYIHVIKTLNRMTSCCAINIDNSDLVRKIMAGQKNESKLYKKKMNFNIIQVAY